MANVDGAWDCVIRTPLGEQTGVLTVRSDGTAFTGDMKGALGGLDVIDGGVDGDTLTWKLDLKVPFPMMLECRAIVSGDAIEGSVSAGAFGLSPLSGTRRR